MGAGTEGAAVAEEELYLGVAGRRRPFWPDHHTASDQLGHVFPAAPLAPVVGHVLDRRRRHGQRELTHGYGITATQM